MPPRAVRCACGCAAGATGHTWPSPCAAVSPAKRSFMIMFLKVQRHHATCFIGESRASASRPAASRTYLTSPDRDVQHTVRNSVIIPPSTLTDIGCRSRRGRPRTWRAQSRTNSRMTTSDQHSAPPARGRTCFRISSLSSQHKGSEWPSRTSRPHPPHARQHAAPQSAQIGEHESAGGTLKE